MKLFQKSIGTYRNGNKLYKEDLKPGAYLRHADLRGADLRGANLRGADLWDADLRWADLRWANLRWANLQADLQAANLQAAHLQGADLRWSDLQAANLADAILDSAGFPLTCGSFGMKADDRLVWQLICHITRLAQDNMSEEVKKVIDLLMPYADRFCEYRDDVGKLLKDKETPDETIE